MIPHAILICWADQYILSKLPQGDRFTLEYADGFYICQDGHPILSLEDKADEKLGQFVVDALNTAQSIPSHKDE